MSTNPPMPAGTELAGANPIHSSPYGDTLGVNWVFEGTRNVLRMPFGNHLVGRPGFLHGGAMAGMVEMAAWFTLTEALDSEPVTAFKPISISVDFLRGGKMIETHATATITRIGRRLAVLEAWAWQEDEASPIVRAGLKFLIVR